MPQGFVLIFSKKAAAAAKNHSSILYIGYNERITTYTKCLPPPILESANQRFGWVVGKHY